MLKSRCCSHLLVELSVSIKRKWLQRSCPDFCDNSSVISVLAKTLLRWYDMLLVSKTLHRVLHSFSSLLILFLFFPPFKLPTTPLLSALPALLQSGLSTDQRYTGLSSWSSYLYRALCVSLCGCECTCHEAIWLQFSGNGGQANCCFASCFS